MWTRVWNFYETFDCFKHQLVQKLRTGTLTYSLPFPCRYLGQNLGLNQKISVSLSSGVVLAGVSDGSGTGTGGGV